MGSVETEFVESVVCKVSDLDSKDGKEFMKETEIGEGKCLVIKHNSGEITAIGHKCVHYGAPLIKGVLKNGRVRCPWHGACFNAKTGDIEDFPGLDSLHKFEVTVKDDDVIVKARKANLVNNKRNVLAGKTCSLTDGPRQKVVIIGGGPSSLTCAETLRKEGYTGRVIIISKDAHPPYDRPKLSKALDINPEAAYLRPLDFYKNVGIELVLDTVVLKVDVVSKKVQLNQKQKIYDDTDWLGYNKLVIATGGTPKTLKPTTGWDLKNVFVLRTPDDANEIAIASKGKKVVVIGSSFIGMEVASFLSAKEIASSISVVCGKRSKVPFQGSLGEQIGKMVMKLHEEKGSIQFYPSAGVTSLSAGEDGKSVQSVTLSDGNVVEADVVVVGIGVTPATNFLIDSEIKLNERGLIPVDGHMLSKIPNIYAVGDVAYFPLSMKDGQLANIQHWQMAHAHGKIAALDILHRTKTGQRPSLSTPKHVRPVNSVPFFWTVQYGMSIRFTGHCPGYDDIVVRGNLEERKFAAYYVKANRVVAISTLGSDPLAAEMAERFNAGEIVTREDIPN